jgi:non-ribosomal peptide synthetase component F
VQTQAQDVEAPRRWGGVFQQRNFCLLRTSRFGTSMSVLPSRWRQPGTQPPRDLARHRRSSHPAQCRLRVSSGGPLPIPLVARFSEKLPQARLENYYGSSEVCGDVLTSTDAGVAVESPFRNSRIYVLDAGLKPVPIGVMGELHVTGGSNGLRVFGTAGTDGRVVCGVSVEAGSRMYRSGDLVRWDRRGRPEFLGRGDE